MLEHVFHWIHCRKLSKCDTRSSCFCRIQEIIEFLLSQFVMKILKMIIYFFVWILGSVRSEKCYNNAR